MASDYPHFVFLVPVDRVIVPQIAIIGVGVGDYLRSEHILVNRYCHTITSLSLVVILIDKSEQRDRDLQWEGEVRRILSMTFYRVKMKLDRRKLVIS
jgi:hypothetical protein